jgi:hypothetical protein
LPQHCSMRNLLDKPCLGWSSWMSNPHSLVISHNIRNFIVFSFVHRENCYARLFLLF